MRESELVCVNCPKGCKITVLLDGDKVKGIRVSAPVKINDVISENFLGTGVNLVASRSIGVVSFKYSR